MTNGRQDFINVGRRAGFGDLDLDARVRFCESPRVDGFCPFSSSLNGHLHNLSSLWVCFSSFH